MSSVLFQCAIPQPARALCHVVSVGVVMSMAYTVVMATKAFM